MNQIEIGSFIAKCRKEKKLTQAQLAVKLNITDRAVSKWECGRCLPDSAIMLELCEILGITVNELLSGEKIRMEDYQKMADENLIALKKKDENNLTKNMIISILFSATLFVGIIVCLICNVAVSGSFTWSLISTGSIVFAWAICFPTILLGKKGGIASLLALSIFTIPFLWLMSMLLKVKEVFSIHIVCIAVVSIVFLWIAFVIFHRTRKLVALGLTFLLCIPLSVVVNMIVSKMINKPAFDMWDFISVFALLAAAFSCFACDYAGNRRT